MNKAIIMGRLTRDPELRYTNANNTPVCSFTLAVDRQFSRQGEERQADFIPIVAWSKTAEFCSKYFTKGLKVAVVGRIQTRTWDDNEGKKHYVTEVVAEEAHFADSKKGEGTAARPSDIGGGQPSDGFYPLEEDDELPF
ncbi:MAG: single-stranded DNA-binding protein [Clostridiaceae bacterium]|nr:single-stranded DNA-binding protein [Clostridiaceae bacterium]